MDFPTLLVISTFVTGLIWAVDALLWAPKRRARVAELEAGGQVITEAVREQVAKESLVVEYARSFFPVILIVLLIRSFLVEPFRIPSGSMMPTLLVGDFILVNKFSYGIRLPVLDKKVVGIGEPERGDIVVFRYPENPSVDYIKRVVGVPGDHIVYTDKTLYINGKAVQQHVEGTYQGTGGGAVMTGASMRREELGSVAHSILVMPNRPDMEVDFTVPPGEYFVMGDNRDNSRDSRFWGTVPDQNLVGKAFFIWMNWDSDANGLVDWSRIGSSIR